LQAAQADLVVVEATGGYERDLVCALQGAGVSVARVNPRQAHDIAKSRVSWPRPIRSVHERCATSPTRYRVTRHGIGTSRR
jgi:hypothetical protein